MAVVLWCMYKDCGYLFTAEALTELPRVCTGCQRTPAAWCSLPPARKPRVYALDDKDKRLLRALRITPE